MQYWLREKGHIMGFRTFPGECIKGIAEHLPFWWVLTRFRSEYFFVNIYLFSKFGRNLDLKIGWNLGLLSIFRRTRGRNNLDFVILSNTTIKSFLTPHAVMVIFQNIKAILHFVKRYYSVFQWVAISTRHWKHNALVYIFAYIFILMLYINIVSWRKVWNKIMRICKWHRLIRLSMFTWVAVRSNTYIVSYEFGVPQCICLGLISTDREECKTFSINSP